MATQGTTKVLGGTPYKRYPDPNVIKGTPNEYGLYPWSTFRARFMYIDNDGYVAPGTGNCSEALLFTSDIPAIVTVSYNISLENSLTSNILSPTVGGTPGVTVSAFGQVAIGYAGANYKVRCSGFTVKRASSTINLNNTDLLDCIANGSVICSPIGRNNYGTGSSINADDKLGTNPIILRASDYTQAMYDNGNIIREVFPSDPGEDGSWIVVGLWLPS